MSWGGATPGVQPGLREKARAKLAAQLGRQPTEREIDFVLAAKPAAPPAESPFPSGGPKNTPAPWRPSNPIMANPGGATTGVNWEDINWGDIDLTGGAVQTPEEANLLNAQADYYRGATPLGYAQLGEQTRSNMASEELQKLQLGLQAMLGQADIDIRKGQLWLDAAKLNFSKEELAQTLAFSYAQLKQQGDISTHELDIRERELTAKLDIDRKTYLLQKQQLELESELGRRNASVAERAQALSERTQQFTEDQAVAERAGSPRRVLESLFLQARRAPTAQARFLQSMVGMKHGGVIMMKDEMKKKLPREKDMEHTEERFRSRWSRGWGRAKKRHEVVSRFRDPLAEKGRREKRKNGPPTRFPELVEVACGGIIRAAGGFTSEHGSGGPQKGSAQRALDGKTVSITVQGSHASRQVTVKMGYDQFGWYGLTQQGEKIRIPPGRKITYGGTEFDPNKYYEYPSALTGQPSVGAGGPPHSGGGTPSGPTAKELQYMRLLYDAQQKEKNKPAPVTSGEQPSGGGGSTWNRFTPAQRAAAIRQEFSKRGLDAEFAVRVAENEALYDEDGIGDHGSSLGMFQLNTNGLLPDFKAQGYTDPFDPFQSAAYVADYVLRTRNWGNWHGARSLYAAGAKPWDGSAYDDAHGFHYSGTGGAPATPTPAQGGGGGVGGTQQRAATGGGGGVAGETASTSRPRVNPVSPQTDFNEMNPPSGPFAEWAVWESQPHQAGETNPFPAPPPHNRPPTGGSGAGAPRPVGAASEAQLANMGASQRASWEARNAAMTMTRMRKGGVVKQKKLRRAAKGVSVEGPAILLVGDNGMGKKTRGTEEFVYAPPGTIVAPIPKGVTPTIKMAHKLLAAKLKQHEPTRAYEGFTSVAGGGNWYGTGSTQQEADFWAGLWDNPDRYRGWDNTGNISNDYRQMVQRARDLGLTDFANAVENDPFKVRSLLIDRMRMRNLTPAESAFVGGGGVPVGAMVGTGTVEQKPDGGYQLVVPYGQEPVGSGGVAAAPAEVASTPALRTATPAARFLSRLSPSGQTNHSVAPGDDQWRIRPRDTRPLVVRAQLLKQRAQELIRSGNVLEARRLLEEAEKLLRRNNMWVSAFRPRWNHTPIRLTGMKRGGVVSPEKAGKILHDGKVRGRPLSKKQRGFFGMMKSGRKMPNTGMGKVIRAVDGTSSLPHPYTFVQGLLQRLSQGQPLSAVDMLIAQQLALAWPQIANVLNQIASYIGQFNAHSLNQATFMSNLQQLIQFIPTVEDTPVPDPGQEPEPEPIPGDGDGNPPPTQNDHWISDALNYLLRWVGDGVAPNPPQGVNANQYFLRLSENYKGLLTAFQDWQAGRLGRDQMLAFINEAIDGLPETTLNNTRDLITKALSWAQNGGPLTNIPADTLKFMDDLEANGMGSIAWLLEQMASGNLDSQQVVAMMYDRLNSPDFRAGQRENEMWGDYLRTTFSRSALDALGHPDTQLFDVGKQVENFLQSLTQRDFNRYSPSQQDLIMGETGLASGWSVDPADLQEKMQRELFGFNPSPIGTTASYGGNLG